MRKGWQRKARSVARTCNEQPGPPKRERHKKLANKLMFTGQLTMYKELQKVLPIAKSNTY